MKKYNLGIIGCGNMSQAILKALSSDAVSYLLKRNGIRLCVRVSDRDTNKLDAIRGKNIETLSDNADLVSLSDYVLLAIKPQIAQDALKGLDFSNKVVMSIMAGVNLARLKDLTGGATEKLVRIMPNLNAKTGQSVNAYCCKGIDEDEEEIVINILGSFGKYYKVNENKMNSITGISGSGPAFVFMFINAFIEKAISCGFNPETAKDMVLQTIQGCVETVRFESGNLSKLVESVCSKGGTTIEGVNFLREVNFEASVREAISRAEKRSEELESSL